MGLFFNKKKEIKKPRELPSLKPDTNMRPGLTSAPLKSDIEHVRHEFKDDLKLGMPPEMRSASALPPLPEKKLPSFPEPEMKPLPKFDFDAPKPKKLPEFPEIKPMPAEEKFFEEESIYEVDNEIEELKHRLPVKPVFVDVEHFKDILDDLNSTKLHLKEGQEIIQKVEEIRLEKDKQFEKWKSLLEDVQRKLIFIDKTLFEIKYV